LSDLRNGNSGEFQAEFNRAIKLEPSNPHCITHSGRRIELLNCIRSRNKILIAAWGDIAELNDSAKEILKLNQNIIGLGYGSSNSFRHASPYRKDQKLKWLSDIQQEIKFINSGA